MEITAAELTSLLPQISAMLAPALTAAGRTGFLTLLTSLSTELQNAPQVAAILAAGLTAEWNAIPAEWQAIVSAAKSMAAAVEALKAKL